MRDPRQNQRYLALTLAATVMLFANSATLMAGSLAGSFDFKIDQNLVILDSEANIGNHEAAIADGVTGLEGSLAAAMSNDMHMAAMWLPYTTVLALRSAPGASLANDKDSTGNIVAMEITLEDGPNSFMASLDGEYFKESYASGAYTLIDMVTYQYQRIDPDQVPTSVSVLDNGKRLALSFGNGGIKPGRTTTFLLGTSTGMYLEDFFNENTKIKVSYEDPESEDGASVSALLSEITVFNESLEAQLAGGTNNGGLHFRESVEAFSVTASINTEPVPEPTSLLLLASGLGCFALRRRRRVFNEK